MWIEDGHVSISFSWDKEFEFFLWDRYFIN
jgi:hypothetical protein